MRAFFAILKDSFREAVDGFVIYVMLALATLVALIVASISFTPDPAEKALPGVFRLFPVIFPDRGRSAAFTGVSRDALEYSATDIQQSGGTVRFKLDVKAKEGRKGPFGVADTRDLFRYSAFVWSKPAGAKIDNPFAQAKGKAPDERKVEIVTPPDATEADLRGVTDDELAGFLKTQFAVFVGTPESDVAVARITDGVAEPNYRFDVELKGATTARGWPQTLKVFFGQVSLGDDFKLGKTVYTIEDWLVGWAGGTGTLLISVIITAFFIPNMLRKGSLDLLISKPIGRSELLIYKYVGGLTFIFLVTTVAVGLVWVALSVRAGYWNPTFLVMIPSLTFSFAILYAVSTAVAVFTRSAIASILITVTFMFALFLVGKAKEFFDINRVFQVAEIPDWAYGLVDVLHAILPRYKDLDRLTAKLLVETNLPLGEARMNGVGLIEYPSWGGALGVSLAFIAVMLALSCWKLSRRDN